MQAKEVACV